MDVRCERCKTLYELDDARVSEAGTTVRCTTCGHVFRVRKKVLLMTEAVGAGGESTAVPPPVVDKPAWRVRSPSGRVIAFRELTSMQKWIVERKFGRDDEISLHGDHWKRLGDIAELQPFFLLLDEVDRVHQLEERLRRAELPDEAPSALERAGGSSLLCLGPTALTPIRPTPRRPSGSSTPSPRPASRVPAAGNGSAARESPPRAAARARSDRAAGRRDRSPGAPSSLRPRRPGAAAAPTGRDPRPGPPSAFSLEEIREATRPSPDDLPMPEGRSSHPQPSLPRKRSSRSSPAGPAWASTRARWRTWTAGRPRPERSKAPWVATVLVVGALGAAAAAYFQIWVPAQEEKLRQEAQRARLERIAEGP